MNKMSIEEALNILESEEVLKLLNALKIYANNKKQLLSTKYQPLYNISESDILDFENSLVYQEFIAKFNFLSHLSGYNKIENRKERTSLENALKSHIIRFPILLTFGQAGDEDRFSGFIHFIVRNEVDPTVLNNLMNSWVREGRKLDEQDEKGQTPLDIAIRVGNIEACRQLAEHGIDLTAQDSEGFTALHTIISFMQKGKYGIEVLNTWIQAGLPTDIPDKQGNTALAYAKLCNLANAVTALESTLDPLTTLLNELALAIISKSNDLLDLMLKAKEAGVDLQNQKLVAYDNITFLSVAMQKRNIEAIKALQKNGVDLEAPVGNGFAPIHILIKMITTNPLHINTLIEWIKAGWSIDTKVGAEGGVYAGKTAVELAENLGRLDIAGILENENIITEEGYNVGIFVKKTSLTEAILEDNIQAVKYFVEKGFDQTPTSKDKGASYKDMKIFELLRCFVISGLCKADRAVKIINAISEFYLKPGDKVSEEMMVQQLLHILLESLKPVPKVPELEKLADALINNGVDINFNNSELLKVLITNRLKNAVKLAIMKGATVTDELQNLAVIKQLTQVIDEAKKELRFEEYVKNKVTAEHPEYEGTVLENAIKEATNDRSILKEYLLKAQFIQFVMGFTDFKDATLFVSDTNAVSYKKIFLKVYSIISCIMRLKILETVSY